MTRLCFVVIQLDLSLRLDLDFLLFSFPLTPFSYMYFILFDRLCCGRDGCLPCGLRPLSNWARIIIMRCTVMCLTQKKKYVKRPRKNPFWLGQIVQSSNRSSLRPSPHIKFNFCAEFLSPSVRLCVSVNFMLPDVNVRHAPAVAQFRFMLI